MSNKTELNQIITAALARLPEWVRAELAAKDPQVRRRAEDTLAATMTAAILAQDAAAGA